MYEPEVVKRWEEMPGCAQRVLSWVRDKVFINPVKKIKRIRKKNARCLRPEADEFDQDKFDFVDKKVKEDRKAQVAHRLGPDNPPHATCPLNAVPKPGGGEDMFRVIGSMIQLNKYFPGWRMRFEDLRHFASIFSKASWCHIGSPEIGQAVWVLLGRRVLAVVVPPVRLSP